MSSTPTPRPQTPSKLPMAIERERQKSSRTPLPNSASRKPEHTDNPGDEVQVPSTSPPTVDGDTPPNQMKQSQSQVKVQVQNLEQYRESQPQNGHSQNANVQNGNLENGHSQANGHHEEPIEEAGEVDLSDLPPFDWEDFRRRYTEDITKINKDEEELLDEFDKLVASFGWWAECAANRDNERAAKRLCTRERYVQLAEDSLDEKKRRYEQVVGAFKQALEMLRNTGI